MQKQQKITHFLRGSLIVIIITCIGVFAVLGSYVNARTAPKSVSQ